MLAEMLFDVRPLLTHRVCGDPAASCEWLRSRLCFGQPDVQSLKKSVATYHRRKSSILAEGLSLTTRPDVEVHYVSESGTPSPPPI
jgi:hypothetical protein